MSLMEANSSGSVPEAVYRAYHSQLQLQLSREDIAFIVGVHTHIEIERSYSLHYSELEKIYGIVNEFAGGNHSSIPQRSKNAIERLLDNNILIRVDGGGVNYRPLYDITRLGKALVSFLSDKEVLTCQNFIIITSRIASFLADIRKALVNSGSDKFWQEKVVMPLKCVVDELLEAIEKRQQGLDQDQSKVRNQISVLLEKKWIDALETCEHLLESTNNTLRELYRTILSENANIKHSLNDIYETAEECDQAEALNIIDKIYTRLEQIEQWGKERISSWSQYYRRVNEFLQSIVCFDSNRALSRKLKKQIQDYPEKPWFIKIADFPVYRQIREIDLPSQSEKITRDKNRDYLPEEESSKNNKIILDLVALDLKNLLINKKQLDFLEIVTPYLQQYSLDEIYPYLGQIIDLILKQKDYQPEKNFKWTSPVPCLELQNLISKPPH